MVAQRKPRLATWKGKLKRNEKAERLKRRYYIKPFCDQEATNGAIRLNPLLPKCCLPQESLEEAKLASLQTSRTLDCSAPSTGARKPAGTLRRTHCAGPSAAISSPQATDPWP
jgi:hypothetical protein